VRVLVSAYTCSPGRGSEPGAGWEWTRAAAIEHDVTLLTRERYRPAIEHAIQAEPGLRLQVHYLPVTSNRLLLRSTYGRYLGWQTTVATWTRQAEAGKFQVVHHLTFAIDWLPAGVLQGTALPAVWGPVGGYTSTSLARIWDCGPTAIPGELGRELVTRSLRHLFGDPAARRSAVVLAQNQDVARRFTGTGQVLVQPNVALQVPDPPTARAPRSDGAPPTALLVGRLVGWKGWRLALAALGRPEAADWRLRMAGSGPDIGAIERKVRRLGLAGRVHLLGQLERQQVLQEMLRADALLQPSLHEAAGWAVAEATAHGCPVVCLAVGGPATLIEPSFGEKVPLGPDLPKRLAVALSRSRPPAEPDHRWSRDRLPGLLREVYADALASGAPR
jgi:glycosyltransferase involved in cell wall biosynthesis